MNLFLQKAFDTTENFTCPSVVAIGDLQQLPPIGGQSIWKGANTNNIIPELVGKLF